MNSSTSSSEAQVADTRGADERVWTRWLGVFALTLVLAVALLLAFLIAIDPYDSGRFGYLGITGVSDINPNTASASRARDLRFNSAIIGDSTGQLLDPGELSRLTSLRFVQLTVQGTGPREQLSILNFFLRHHDRVGALVIAVDPVWCTRDAALAPPHPFPFWLYDAGRLEYALRVFSLRSLGRAWRRVQIGRGRREPTRPDGYWDYMTLGTRDFRPEPATLDTSPAFAGTVSEDFPAVTRLAAALGKIPDVPVVLVAPPVYHTHVPRPGSRLDAEDRACKRALQRLADGRRHGRFIDYRVESELTRDQQAFRDVIHVNHKGARLMEQEIGKQLRQ
jgi:hypothetical protein